MRALPLVALSLLASAAASAAAPKRWTLSDVEVYGTESLAPEDVLKKHGEQVRHILARWGIQTPAAQKEAESMLRALERELRSAGGFGWLQVEVVNAGSEDGGAIKGLILVDVVEKAAMTQRYPFRPSPKADVKDASGLLAAWDRYDALARASAMASSDELNRAVCPAFYCPEGHGGPDMDKLETEFISQVPAYKQLLLRVLREDADADKRAKALYLLTYLHDAGDVTALVSFGLTDPDTRVREAAVTVLNDIAIHRKDVMLPVRDVARLLDYPAAEDRQRGLALILSASDNPDSRSIILGPAADQVLRLLREKHPGVRQMAYTVLGFLSGEKYAETDYDAWDKWLWKERQNRVRKGGK